MATYLELRNLFNDGDLLNKIDVAIIVAADALILTTPTTAEKDWAATALGNPRPQAEKALKDLLATNKDATVGAIQGSTDAAIQTRVDAVISILVDAQAGV
jgi:hypothetical protein